MRISEWARQVAFLSEDRPISYEGRQWAPGLLDTISGESVWQTSRQVGKSVQALLIHLFYMCNYKDYGVLYVVPEYRQAKEFSIDRVAKMFRHSPLFAHMHSGVDNESFKGFGNGSRLQMRWVGHNIEGIRGLSEYSMLHIDEAQSLDLEDIIPILMQIMFAAKSNRRRIISGTPLSNENALTRHYWEKSDQREWVVRCRHHTPTLYLELERRNIGKEGPACHICGNHLNVDDGLWVAMRPDPKGTPPEERKTPGFHVHQMHCRLESHPNPERWRAWVRELEDYSDEKADNEVFGWATDTAEIPITEEILKRACVLPPMRTEPEGEQLRSNRYAGIDWGQGEASTCNAIVQKRGDRYHVLFMHDWKGQDTHDTVCVPEIEQQVTTWSCARVHADFGAGYDNNDKLYRHLKCGVTQNMWSANAIDADGRWHTEAPPFTVVLNKSRVMTKVLRMLQQGKILFPSWESIRKFAWYFLNVRKEMDNKGYIKFIKAGPEDMWQAVVYAILICEMDTTGVLGG